MERYLFPIDDRGRTFSYTRHRMVKLTPAMIRLVNALETHGDVDTIRDGGTVATVVALMNRGILREATPRSHGKGSGHHYPATTPAQVWDDAHAEYREVTREARKADADAYQREIAQDIRDGNYTIVMGEPVVTPAQAHQRAVQEAAEAYNRGDIDDDGNWRGEDAVVRNIPLPAPQTIGITDADGNALVMGDVVRVDGDATLYGTVYRGDGDDMWGIPLGSEQEQRIDATRMRRVERGADGKFPTPTAPEGWTRVTFTYDGRTRIALKCTDDSGRWSLGGSLLRWESLLRAAGGKVINAPEETPAAPSLADDVAVLRTLISATAAPDGEAYAARNRAMAALDRIAAQVPQQARAWIHPCGAVRQGDKPDGQYCFSCLDAHDWRPLYTVVALDRIAARVPQRATLWMHETCGHTIRREPGPGLTACAGCKVHTDKWQALYTLGDAK